MSKRMIRGPGHRLRPLALEALEERWLLTVSTLGVADGVYTPTALYGSTLTDSDMAALYAAANQPSTNDYGDVKNGPLAKGGDYLVALDQEFQSYQVRQAAGDTIGTFQSELRDTFRIEGDQALMYLSTKGSYADMLKRLNEVGITPMLGDATMGVATAYVPLSEIRNLASWTEIASMRPVDRPVSNTQGIADNQADRNTRTDQLRAQTGLTGAGIVVGVISDTATRVGGGLADSVATGDLPPGVVVLQDDTSGTDEGRGMMELIHDIAPGSGLAFNTANFGQQGFATGIDNLRTQAGADVIVDDITYLSEPFFQPGAIDQAIFRAFAANVPYFSSVQNSGNSGIEQPTSFFAFGNGTFMDWNPGAGQDANLRITTTQTNSFSFQWNQPYNGLTGAARADLDIFFINVSTGSVVRQGISDNLESGIPLEFINNLPAGTYDVQVRLFAVASGGTAPSVVKFTGRIDMTSVEYADASISRSATYGHNAGLATISVGAVPFFGAPPFANPSPILSESFSSRGPVVHYFDSSGTALASPNVLLRPQISAIDGVNTSFFGGDIGTDTDTFPNFFGTSAAAPNAAALTALLRQFAFGADVSTIYNALVASTVPLNGAAVGAWDPQGGFGLIDGIRAYQSLGGNLQPDIDVQGNGNSIVIGDATPSTTDNTDFGGVSVSSGTIVRQFVIRNTGSIDLNLTGSPRVALAGGQLADFTVTTQPSAAVIAAGSSLTFSITFNPSAIGLRQTQVQILNNDTDEGIFTFIIQGTGNNTAPVLNTSGAPFITAINEDDLANAGTQITTLLSRAAGGDPITDADGDPDGIAITALSTATGSWQFSLDNGVSWAGIGIPSIASARLLPSTTNTRIRYLPNLNTNGTISTAVTFRAWDRSSGVAGGLLDTTTNGGNTSVSSNTETASIVVNSINDAPMNRLPASQGTRPSTPIILAGSSGNLLSIADVDAASLRFNLTAGGGTMTLATTSGLTVTGNNTASISATGTIANLNAALNGLRYSPTAGFLGNGGITITSNDLGNSGTGGTLLDTDVLTISVRNAVSVEGNVLYLTGTTGNDTGVVTFGSPAAFSYNFNSLTGNLVVPTITRVVVISGPGGDTFTVNGSNTPETSTFYPNAATVTNGAYQVEINRPSTINVFGSSNDTALFYDSPTNDAFYGQPTSALFVGGGAQNQAIGYGAAYAFSNAGGADVTLLFDSAGDDVFYSLPDQAIMLGTGYLNQTVGYDASYAFASTGTDIGVIYDTPGDDFVFGLPGYTALVNGGYVTQATSFDFVYTLASTGNDTAVYYDSPGNEFLISEFFESTFSGSNFLVQALYYDVVIAVANSGGFDTAVIFDSTGDDVVTSTSDITTLVRVGSITQAAYFDSVTVNAILGGNDVSGIFDGVGNDVLDATGTRAIMSYVAGNTLVVDGFDSVTAFSIFGGVDQKRVRSPIFSLTIVGPFIDI